MELNKIYKVAGHYFKVHGSLLCSIIDKIDGFKPFETQEDENICFSFIYGKNIPLMENIQYEFSYEDVKGRFGRSDNGYLLELQPYGQECLYLWTIDRENIVQIKGNLSIRLYRFALWLGYGLMVLPYDTVAIHSSCIVYDNSAVLFLGESGTGKSTHTRLWCENIIGAVILNDDSPIVRVESGKVWVYGSPWSGKTPCYKQERYELAGCVRLSQAPFNKILELSVLKAYAAIHPSCPPEFAYDNNLYGYIGGFIGKLIPSVKFYHLECLPDKEAAELSCKTIF
jgi:hypothetical protein